MPCRSGTRIAPETTLLLEDLYRDGFKQLALLYGRSDRFVTRIGGDYRRMNKSQLLRQRCLAYANDHQWNIQQQRLPF
jgi:hypothetical protein